jgi:hypothetical protein
MKTTRQHTRAIVRVDSHVRGVVMLSRDVVKITTSKQVKGAGKFQLTLVPRRNYLNLIFPNDVVNIYFDPGDGRGFIRTMMGYVDRIEREEQTDPQTGAMTTMFHVYGSDFFKAIEKTDIYFNPALRVAVDERFGTQNLGGSAMRTHGIRTHGSPADFVENMLEILMGFGDQWSLPDSYPKTYVKALRQQRAQRVKARIPTNLKEYLKSFGITNLDDINQSLDAIWDKTKTNIGFIGTILSEAAEKTNGVFVTTPLFVKEIFQNKQIQLSQVLQGESTLLAYRNVLQTMSDSFPAGIIDLIDFSLIEALTVDGFVSNQSIWQYQGSVAQFMYGHCNEIVNELCFDLRPVALNDDGYSYEPDELSINTNGADGFPATAPAVRYVPSVMLREYPYSVVEGIDMSDYGLNLDGETDKVGLIGFGPIFAVAPNEPGRHTYDYSDGEFGPLIAEACLFEETGSPKKHIDVVIIDNSDVVNSQIGRSDEDTVNLFALYANNSGAMHDIWKYALSEFCPLLNYVSIKRHGLRTREQTTEFANYSRDPLCRENSSAVDNKAIRRNLVRWQLLMDHWYQHNVEYLSGNINLRGMPEIRVGYRLDWRDHHESYYVDQVSNTWEFPGALRTTVHVSRGQRNDPYPVYVPPTFVVQNGTSVDVKHSGNRGPDGRLSKYFPVLDTKATAGAVGVDRVGEPSSEDVQMNTLELQAPLQSGAGRVIQAYPLNRPGIQRVIDEETRLREQINNPGDLTPPKGLV